MRIANPAACLFTAAWHSQETRTPTVNWLFNDVIDVALLLTQLTALAISGIHFFWRHGATATHIGAVWGREGKGGGIRRLTTRIARASQLGGGIWLAGR